MNKLVKLSKTKKYVLGVSGGPDSMALFDMCREQGICVVATHMNYQKRDSAIRDEEIVKAYCDKYGIPCAISRQNKECIGNFQAFAREERYHFYKEVMNEYHCDAVLLAHHLDDHLETYIMQKNRGSLGEYWGIKEETTLYDCTVIRPLLANTKDELLSYCVAKHVPFGVDESNLHNDYTRNQIRHDVIDQMSHKEKEELAQQIKFQNIELLQQIDSCGKFLANWNEEVEEVLNLSHDMQALVISTWIFQNTHVRISSHELSLLLGLIANKSKQWTRDIKKMYSIYNEYGKLCIDEKKVVEYSYELSKISFMETNFFKLQEQGLSTEALTLHPDDFPIVIRNVKEGDSIQLRFGKKRVHRWFIDRKIPRKLRKKWPIVLNAKGNIILVPGIGCDIEHFSNNPNVFVVK